MNSVARTILALGTLLMLNACSRISVTTKPNPAAPHFEPTSTMSVEILRKQPTRKSIQLGEIVIEPGTRMTDLALDLRLKQAAAELGANAAYIKSDKNWSLASASSGGFANTYEANTKLRVVTADALRYAE